MDSEIMGGGARLWGDVSTALSPATPAQTPVPASTVTSLAPASIVITAPPPRSASVEISEPDINARSQRSNMHGEGRGGAGAGGAGFAERRANSSMNLASSGNDLTLRGVVASASSQDPLTPAVAAIPAPRPPTGAPPPGASAAAVRRSRIVEGGAEARRRVPSADARAAATPRRDSGDEPAAFVADAPGEGGGVVVSGGALVSTSSAASSLGGGLAATGIDASSSRSVDDSCLEENASIAPMSPEPKPTRSAPNTPSRGSGGGGAVPPPLQLNFVDMRTFLTTPTPKACGIVQCYIEREHGMAIIAALSYPTFSLHLREGDKFLLAGKKRTKNKTSNYVITMDKRDLARDSPSFLGKLRANFMGTEFTLFDDGDAPEARAVATPASLRHELAVVHFASNVLSSRGPRKMKVATPKTPAVGKSAFFQPDKDEDSMIEQFKQGLTQNMFLMINKPPKWHDQVSPRQ